MNSEVDQTIRYFSPKEFATIIGVSTSTLRRWEKEGFVNSLRTPEGERTYTSDMIEKYRKQKEYQAYLKSQLSKKRTAIENTHRPQSRLHSIVENWHKIGFIMLVLSLILTLIATANILRNTPLGESSWLRPIQSVLAAFDSKVPRFNSLFSAGEQARPVRADIETISTPTPTNLPSINSGTTLTTLYDIFTGLVARFDAFTVQNPIANYQETNVTGTPTPTPILDITSFPHRSHSSLTNLTNSDDHAQYVYKSGRAGGQTLVGGIYANDVLTLQSSTATTGTGSGEKALKIIVGSGGETEALTILNNGNIGFQKTNPGFTLDVGGIVNATAIYVNGTPYIGSQWTTAGSDIFYDTGNVGIGVTNPTAALDLLGSLKATGLTLPSGAVDGYVLTTDANGVASWNQMSMPAGLWSLTGNNLYPNSTSNNLAIGAVDSGSAKLYVNGNVGIGTSAPLYNLDVAGTSRFTGDLRLTGVLYDTSSSAGSSGYYLQSTGTGTSWTSLMAGSQLLPIGTEGHTLYNNAGTWTANSGLFYDDVNGNVGIGTTNPVSKLSVMDGGLLVTGTTGGTPISGSGTRLMWVPAKKAFRIGTANGTGWDAANIGDYSFAGGWGVTASDYATFAFGDGVTASGDYSIVFGSNSTVSGYASFASGQTNTVSADFSAVFGTSNSISGSGSSFGAGEGIAITGAQAIALGSVTSALGSNTLAFGNYVTANAYQSHIIGEGAGYSSRMVNNIQHSLMIGYNSTIPTLFVGPSAGAGTVGKVGIGTTSPASLLDVHGTTWLRGTTGGTSGLFVNSSGNVGVGTTSPGAKLEVYGGNLKLKGATSVGAYIEGNQLASNFITFGGAGYSDLGGIYHGSNYDPNGWTVGTGGVGMAFYTFTRGTSVPTEKLRITALGNVGIGTTSPTSMLSVGASSQFQVDSSGNIVKLNNVTTSFPSSQGAANSILRNDGAGTLTWADPTGTGAMGYWQRNGTTLSQTNITDNLGIGSTAPTSAMFYVPGSTDNDAWFNLGTGNLGIGTTSPDQKLDVAGEIELANYLYFGNGTNEYLRWDGSDFLLSDDFLPNTDDSLDLGSNIARWKDLYLGGETLHLGSSTTDEGTISYTSSDILSFDTDTTNNGDIAFFTDDLYLDKSLGYVGIGTAQPGSLLNIFGTSNQFKISNSSKEGTIEVNGNGTMLLSTSATGYTDVAVNYKSIPTTNQIFSSLNFSALANNTGTIWTELYRPLGSGNEQLKGIAIDTDNNVVYVGYYDGYIVGGGAIYRCHLSTGCDTSGDWTVAYSNESYDYSSLVFDNTNNTIYATATDISAGVIRRCATSTGCDDDGDWTTINIAKQMKGIVIDDDNNVIYAGDSAGDLYRCDLSTGCDAVGEWSLITTFSGTNINTILFDDIDNVLYAPTQSDGIIHRCSTSTGCDASGEWTTSYDATQQIYAMGMDTTGGIIYAGGGSGFIYRCATTSSCDEQTDWTISYDSPISTVYTITYSSITNKMYAGGSGAVLYECSTSSQCNEGTDWSSVYDGSDADLFVAMIDTANSQLLIGTGNANNSVEGALVQRLEGTAPVASNYAQVQGKAISTTHGSIDGALLFNTMSAGTLGTKMYITQVGNVGIGTTLPQNKLSVAGAASLGATYANIAAPSNGLIVEGNVGIGTTSPTYTLEVQRTGSTPLRLTAQNFSGILFTQNQGSLLNRGYLGADDGSILTGVSVGTMVFRSEGALEFGTNGNNRRMIIDMAGNVGIGTTSPTSMLSLGASSQFQVDSSGNIVKLNNVTTSFPSSQGAANSILRNDGAGTLTWADPTGTGVMAYWQRNGTSVAPTTITDSLGIGTTAPVGKFDITDTSNTLSSLSLTNNTATTIGAGINTVGVLDLQSTSLSTGNFLNMEVNGLTSGKGLNLTSNSTVLSTGNLASIDWSPSGSTEIFATGDLFKINTGTYANIGNLFALYDDGSELFSVDQSKITNSLPTEFTSPGDVSMAYDLQFTNASTANIKSDGPLTISSGEVFGSNNLTLKTYNQGSVLVDYADSGTTANNHTALQVSPVVSGAISTGTRNIFGLYNNPISTAANSGGTSNLYGSYIVPSSTLATAGATNVYGSYISGTATHAADAGTVNQYGLYIANGTSSTNGISTKYGLYVEAPTGADTNVAGYFGGNVGIGTTAPNALLQIEGGAGVASIVFSRTGLGTSTAIGVAAGTNNFFTGAGINSLNIRTTTGTSLNLGVDNGAGSAAPAVTINSAGNVGIGTTSPGYMLDIKKINTAQLALGVTNDPTGYNGLMEVNYNALNSFNLSLGTNTFLQFDVTPSYTTTLGVPYLNASINSRVYIPSFVGIGTTNPEANLEINDSATQYRTASNSSLAKFGGYMGTLSTTHYPLIANLNLRVPSITESGSITVDNASTLYIEGAPSVVAAGNANYALYSATGKNYFGGNVGIGTTAPTNPLQVADTAGIRSGTASKYVDIFTSGEGNDINSSHTLHFNYSNNQAVSIGQGGTSNLFVSGNMGIGTTAPTYTLDVKSTGTDIARFNGTNSTGCTLSDGGVIACSSDRNLKKNILETQLGLDAVMSLRPVEFNWNSQQDGDRKSLGFIAQEVEQIAPSLVMTDSNGYKQLNSIGLIPLLAKAIQEQQDILNQVQDDTLKAQDDIGEVEEQTVTLSELTTKVNAWDAIIIPLQTIVKEIQDMFISLQTQLGLVRTDVDTTKDQVASLSASLNSMNVDYTSWKEAIASGSGVLGASNSALLDKLATVSSLLVKDDLEVGGKTTTFDLAVLNKLTSGVIEIGAGVAGDEINSAGGIRFQTLAQGPIDFMNGKVVIDVDGSITAKHLKLDTTDFTSSTAGTSVLKAGKTTIQVDTTSITSDSLVFITPITLTDIPIAVTQKSTSIGFTVTIPQTISKDLEFQWLVIN